MADSKQLKGILAAIATNVIFGFSFIFSKTALSFAEPLVILAVRFTLAFLMINLVILCTKTKLTFKNKPNRKLILMGIVQPLLYYIFELYGLSKVSSALSGVVISLVPILVVILASVFLKEKPTAMQIICTIVSIAGVSGISIISNDGSKNHLTGILFLVGAVLCASVFNVLSRGISTHFSPFERTYVMFLIGCISFNILAVFSCKGNYISALASAFSSYEFIIAIIYLSLISSVLAFILYNYSTTVISSMQSSSFSNIITVVTVLAGVIILKENFSVMEYIFCFVTILGVLGTNIFEKSNLKKRD